MTQPWGDCMGWGLLQGWWVPQHFLLAGLGMGPPTSWICPGPDSIEGSGPESDVLREQRDGC